jgi:predicted acylesterase/phospholipase RssA
MLIGLAGHGARSFAHVGVMQAVFEAGIQPDGYCGASGGAIMASLLANGWTLDEIRKWCLGTRFDKLITPNRWGLIRHLGRPEGLMDNRKLGEEFDRLQKEGRLKPLNNLWINAAETNGFDERVFTESDYARLGYGAIIRATTAIPGAIAPVVIDGVEYSDGGICANPCLPPFETQRKILIFHLGYPGRGKDGHSWIKNLMRAGEAIQWHRDRALWANHPNVTVIKMSVLFESSTDFGLSKDRKEALMNFGYIRAKAALKELEQEI